RLDLIPQSRHARTQVGKPSCAAHETDRRSLETTARTGESLLFAERHCCVASLATGERLALPAGEQTRTPRRVVYANDRSVRVARGLDQLRRPERALPRFLVGAIDEVDDRPAVPLAFMRGAGQWTPLERG